MKIGIVGIGALGCLLGAHLSEVTDIVLIGHWPEQVATIRDQGLWLEHPDGSLGRYWPTITADPAQVGEVDVVIVAVKSRQTQEAAEVAAGLLGPEGLAVTLQNGLNNCATLRQLLGVSRVTLGVTSQGSTLLGAGQVRHAGRGPTHFGMDPALGMAQLFRLHDLVALFNRAGFESYLVSDMDGLVWGKLAVNAAINPLTALLRVPNGFLLEHPALIDLMSRAAREVASVAEAQGIALPFPDPAERAMAVAAATATNRSSMLQDVTRGVPTEVEAICGAVARVARDLGIATPMNVKLCKLVRQVENGRPPLVGEGDVDALLRLLGEEPAYIP